LKQMLQALEPQRVSSSVARPGSKQKAEPERSLQ
jgi:hypothetical protein